jgi:hypothetical protein
MMMWNFKKNAVVASLDLVPEQYKGLYVEGAGENVGKFVISPIALQLANDYDGVNNALADERNKSKNKNTEAATFRTQLAKFQELAQSLGLSIEEGADLAELLKGHVDGLNDQVKGGKEAKINLDKVNAEWTKKLGTAVDTEKGKTSKMQNSLERHLIGQAATAALAAANGSTDLLLPHVQKHVKVVQDGEEFVARVVDNVGDIRTNGAGQPMSVADLVAEMKTQASFAPAFKSDTKGGSGKQPGNERSPVNTRQGEAKTANDKIAAGLAARGVKE